MTQERFRQIEELSNAAREASASERAAILAQGDAKVRRELESLLVEAIDGDFIERLPSRTPRPRLSIHLSPS